MRWPQDARQERNQRPMGLEFSSEKEKEWIQGEHRRQKFYYGLVVITFLLMAYSFIEFIIPDNALSAIYRITFFYAFLAFMVSVLILNKSRKYLRIIDMILEERRKSF